MKNIPHVAGLAAAAVMIFMLATVCAAFAAATHEIVSLPRAAQENSKKITGDGDGPSGTIKVRSGQVAIVAENGVSLVSILKDDGEVLEIVGALEKMSKPIRWCFERATSIGAHVNVIGLRVEPENAAPYMEESSLQCWVTACPIY